MANKHAPTLDRHGLATLLDEVLVKNPHPLVMKVAFMLSYYAGLRVQEIAGLRWDHHVMDHRGAVRTHEYPMTEGPGDFVRDNKGKLVVELLPTIFIGDDISKYTGEREIPVHPDLKEALEELHKVSESEWVVPSGKSGAQSTLKHRAHALCVRINRVYEKMGLKHHTSHSGRRSYITRGARVANMNGASIRDIQRMAGHRNIKTTQAYLEENLSGQARTTEAMWA